jgi:ComF family protein
VCGRCFYQTQYLQEDSLDDLLSQDSEEESSKNSSKELLNASDECLKIEGFPAFDQVRFACFYQGDTIKKLLINFKYKDHLHLTSLFIEHINNILPNNDPFWDDLDVLTNVPLHWTRLFMRQYNQAALLARDVFNTILKRKRLLFLPDLLIRHKRTVPQKSSAFFRFKNVEGAFSLNIKALKKHSISNKRILIVDDVMTSGATMHFLAQLLKDNGAQSVKALCVAKVDR